MPDLDWCWYDTCVMGAVAGAAFELFQVQLGADGTHNEQYTNLPLPGQIPQNEKFSLERIVFMTDFVATALADLRDWVIKSIYELKVNDTLVWKAPLGGAAGYGDFQGLAAIAAAASQVAGGRQSDGQVFKRPVLLKGGDFFKVRVVQGIAITAASNIKCMLYGTRSV